MNERARTTNAPPGLPALSKMPTAALIWADSGTDGFQMSRVAQDCVPKTIWRLSSGRKDAQVGHIKAGVPLPESKPHADKAE